MGDRIEIGTFCVIATLAKGDLLIKKFDPKLIKTELNLLKVGQKLNYLKIVFTLKDQKN